MVIPFVIVVLSAQVLFNRSGVTAVFLLLHDLYRFVYTGGNFVSLYV
jgi:hypothetical protein